MILDKKIIISTEETMQAISLILDIEDNIFPNLCDKDGKPAKLNEYQKCVYLALRIVEHFSQDAKEGEVSATADELVIVTKAVQIWYKNKGRDIITSLGGLVSIIKGGLLPEVAAQVRAEME